MKNAVIYGLYSTENSIIRYVGYTTQKLGNRVSSHKSGALKQNMGGRKNEWIREVYNKGHEVIAQILEEITEDEWNIKEEYWINELKNNKLLNEMRGGKLGPGGKFQDYVSYEEAKKIIHENFPFIGSIKQFYKFVKENKEEMQKLKIPNAPMEAYTLRGEWGGWNDFLNAKNEAGLVIHSKFPSFLKMKEIIKPYKFTKVKDYEKIAREKGFPVKPYKTYKEEWKGWNEYFQNQEYNSSYLKKKNKPTFTELKEIIKPYKFNSFKKYRKFAIDNNYPIKVFNVYKEEWNGWEDFLGTFHKNRKPFIKKIKEETLIIKKEKIKKQKVYKKKKKEEKNCVYGLYSTEDSIIRYVGYTKGLLRIRKAKHKCEAVTNNRNGEKCEWIREIYRNGFELGTKVLEYIENEDHLIREKFWINKLLKRNNLFNEIK